MVMLALHISGKKTLDSNNDEVLLRGVNMARFIDSADGDWVDATGNVIWNTWNTTYITNMLDEVQRIGCNCIRALWTSEYWISNTSGFKQNIKDFLTLCDARGIYVVFGGWRVSAAGTQCGLPYPPFNGGAGDTAVIADEAAFVAHVADVANELKAYNNYIIELWNEPGLGAGGGTQLSWFTVTQSAITAIRATGATNIIVISWGSFGVDYINWGGGSVWGLDWVATYPLVDASTNLLYSVHIYPDEFYNFPNASGRARTLADIQWAFNKTGLDIFAKAMWIGECGPNQWYSGDDLAAQNESYSNTLTELDTLGFGYNVWTFWVTGQAFPMFENGVANYDPTIASTIFQTHLTPGGGGGSATGGIGSFLLGDRQMIKLYSPRPPK